MQRPLDGCALGVIQKIAVYAVVQTTSQLIRGKIHVREGERLKDELDRDELFLAMTEASILAADGQVQREALLGRQRQGLGGRQVGPEMPAAAWVEHAVGERGRRGEIRTCCSSSGSPFRSIRVRSLSTSIFCARSAMLSSSVGTPAPGMSPTKAMT